MKNSLTTYQEALMFQLKGLYDAEKKIQSSIPGFSRHAASISLIQEMKKYVDSSSFKLLKLERIFNCLMEDPHGRNNEVIDKMLDEIHSMLMLTPFSQWNDILIAGCLQNINHYKISGYTTAKALASEMQSDTVSDLLYQILLWERQTDLTVTNITNEEINRKSNIRN
jgi:Mn-containing catalase